RASLAGAAPRPLRRVQPGLRPRHAVRARDRRPHRVDPGVDAAGRRVELRARASAGQPRGGAARRPARAARLAAVSEREGESERVDVAVVGAGIAGLVIAYRLARAGARVVVLEELDAPGGVIRSQRWEGALVEGGPNSF